MENKPKVNIPLQNEHKTLVKQDQLILYSKIGAKSMHLGE